MRWFQFGLLALAALTSATQQLPFKSSTSPTHRWSSLGPFPVGTREGPLLPPRTPDFDLNRHPSPLSDGGFVHVRTVDEDDQGWVRVGDDSVRWNALRATAGWAVLQHEVVYTRNLTVHSPSLHSFDLTGASEFSILSLSSSSASRTWYNGNIYSYTRTPPHLIELEAGVHEITVTYAYDVRVSGDPSVDGVPKGRWKLCIRAEEREVLFAPARTLLPDVVRGWAAGNVIGVEVTNKVDKILTIDSATISGDDLSVSLASPITLHPLQTRQVVIHLAQNRALRHMSLSLNLTARHNVDASFVLSTPLLFRASPTSLSSPNPMLSTFITNSGTVTYALYTPPTSPHSCARVALLALHGAGVDPASSPSWTSSIGVRDKEWIVWPLGLTEWGYDWHGPSLQDVLLAVQHLSHVEELWRKAWSLVPLLDPECSRDKKLIALGHSNGGQGAWHFMSHFPDLVVGGVPASGFVKIQDYVSYGHHVGQHYRDPALTGILNAALSAYDNDLYTSNLAGVPILSRHGADDDNVPVQHSRQMTSLIDQWSSGNSSTQYSEVPLAGHWFNEVLSSKTVNNFLASMLVSPPQPPFPLTFTITTANPDESGSKHGFRIIELEVPGRIARIEVTIYEPVGGVAGRSRAVARTRNVRRLSLDPTVAPIALSSLSLNGEDNFEIQSSPSGSPVVYSLAIDGRFSIASDSPPARRYGPLLSILSSTKPLHIVIGTQGLPRLTLHLASIARRISHDMLVYGRVNSLIVLDRDVRLEELDEGKLVLLGDSFSNMMTRSLETSWPVPVSFLSPSAFAVNSRVFEAPGQGLIFLAPHPTHASSLALVLAGVDEEGLERAARLFPVRTGVSLPDWAVSSSSLREGGIEAAGFWDAEWGWSEGMSFL